MTIEVIVESATPSSVEVLQAESGFSVELSLVPIGAKGDVGDVNPDTIIAKNQAVAAANEAEVSQMYAAASEAKAKDWASKTNGPVENGEYSAKKYAQDSGASSNSAAASAASAALITYGDLIMHPNKITESINIPDGFNAFLVDPVEIGPNVTITGLGNSTLRGL